MPVHDWSRVHAGTFHHFHNGWIVALADVLNAGLLPDGYYALSEQHTGRLIADVLTLQVGENEPWSSGASPALAVADAPPRVSRRMTASPNAAYRATRKTLAIRTSEGHRLVALLEIVSPANRDRRASVNEFVEKVHAALQYDLHVLVIDLHPPGKHDPNGIHAAIWESLDPEDYLLPKEKPLTLAAYTAGVVAEAFVEHLSVGDALPDMPLFLTRGSYVNVPLESTYTAAYRGVPTFWRKVIEGG